MKKIIVPIAIVLGATAASVPAFAEYPERPIKFMVGFAPGGGTDLTARVLAKKMSEILKQPVQVENRAGAGGNVASELTVKSKPDGYTILLGSIGPLAINQHLWGIKTFDPMKDLTAVSLAVNVTPVVAVHPSLPVKTPKEFIAFMKANPNKVQYSTSGVGSANHMAGELLGSILKSKLIHVSSRGASEAITNLQVGQVQVIITGTAGLMPLFAQKKARAIAVTTLKRSSVLPEIPTLAESSPETKGFDANNWYGVVTPANTPRPIVDKLNSTLRAVLTDAEVKKELYDSGLDANPTTPEEFARYIVSENAKWMKVVRETGTKVNK